MGTKVQSKTYYPGQHSTRDMNNNVYRGMWDLYREDKTLEHSQYSFLTRPAIDGYAGYEKEQLRQTLLKQESMFRHQLQELHRLYKRQRDLMYECKREELQNHPMMAVTSKLGPFASRMDSEDAQGKPHLYNSRLADSKFGHLSTLGTDCIQSPLILGKGESTVMDCKLLSSKSNMSQKRMFDLELPASLYMHNDRAQQVDKIHDSGLADLNKPVQVEEVTLPASVNNLRNNSHLKEELQRQDVCINSNSGVWFSPLEVSQNFFAKRHTGICLDDDKPIESENRNGQSTYHLEAGPTRCHDRTYLQGTYPDHSSPLANSEQVEPRKVLEHTAFPITDHCKPESQRKRTLFGVEISEGDPQQFRNASQTRSLQLSDPRSDVVNCESSFDVPWRKTPILSGAKVLAFQDDNDSHGSFDPSCGNAISLRQLPEFLGGKRHVNSKLRSVPSLRGKLQTDSCHNFTKYIKQSEGCTSSGFGFPSAINSKDTWVERVWQCHSTENSKGSEVVNSLSAVSADWQKQENHERRLPRLTAKPKYCVEQIKGKENIYQMNLDTLQNHSQRFFKKAEITKGPAQVSAQESTSVAFANDSELEKVETSHGHSVTKILGFPIVDIPDIPNSPSCLSTSIDHDVDADDKNVGKDQPEVKELVMENGLNNSTSGLRHHIDLNLTLSEEESPLPPFPKAILKIAKTEVDLEAPSVLESEAVIFTEADTKLPLDDSRDPHEQLVKVAAEAIMTISTSSSHMADAPHHLVEASANCLLLWFADIISSEDVRDGLVELDDVIDEESIPEGMDYFEVMTLRLKDTKEEDYCYKPMIFEKENDVPTQLLKRPRKGQGRRGRQRKDFQRDIMPSIASLSRREVTEDLQTFEDVFTATGDMWQSSLSKRKAARNGRGRRRLVEPDPSLIVTAVRPPPIQQPICREVALEEKSLGGWGKRTRRLPRQRCTNGNHALALKC